MAVELSLTDRALVAREEPSKELLMEFCSRYDCSMADLRAAVAKERMLATIRDAKDIEDLRPILLALARKVM